MHKMYQSGENIRSVIRVTLVLVFCTIHTIIFAQSLIVDKITVKGNSILPKREIVSVLKMREESLFYSYIYYSDVDSITRLYRENGFPDAFVEGTYKISADNRVSLEITIKEGPPQIITSLTVNYQGYDLENRFKRFISERWSISAEDTIRIDTTLLLQEHGYFKPEVTISRTIQDTYSIALIVSVNPGQQYLFGDVYVTGNSIIPFTHVAREAEYVKGDLFVRSKVIELQERLLRLSVFTDVIVKLSDNNGIIDTHIEVKEDKFKWVGFDIGFTSPATGRFGIEWGNNNYFNNLIKVTLSNKNEVDFEGDNYKVSFGLTGQKNWLFGKRLILNGSLFAEKEKQELYELFSVKLTGSLKKELIPNVYTVAGFEKKISSYTRIEESGVATDSWLTLNALFVNPYYDSVENKMHPIEDSMYINFFAKMAGGFLQGDWQYLQTNSEVSLYKNVLDEHYVSVVHVHHKTMSSVNGVKNVPVEELFSLGGAYDIRGYDYGGIGNDFHTIMYANKEERVKIYGNWWGELFFDAGFGLGDKEGFSSSSIKYGAGAGIRYVLPFIIVRADYAFRLIRDEYQFHFAIGQVF